MQTKLRCLLYISALLLISCEDEQTKSRTNILTITETSHASDDPTLITHIEQFTYREKRLELYTNIQSYNESKISNTSTVHYKGDSVITTDNNENKHTYMIDSRKHAVMCEFNDSERLHVFTSNAEGYLEKMTEYVNKKIYYSISFVYANGNLVSTTTESYANNEITPEKSIQFYTTGNLPNKDGLPFLPLTEVYPLYFHQIAYYAGLMGKPIKNLPESSFFEGNTHEKTIYNYKTNAEGRLTSCTVNTVSYESSYSRTFNYSYK